MELYNSRKIETEEYCEQFGSSVVVLVVVVPTEPHMMQHTIHPMWTERHSLIIPKL